MERSLVEPVATIRVDAPAAPVPRTAAATEASPAQVVRRDVHADGEAGRDDDVESLNGEPDREGLTGRPRDTHQQQTEELRLLAPHEARPCTNEAAFAHSPRSASSSLLTHPDRTARRSSSRK